MISAITFPPSAKIPKKIFLPVQTHSTNIVEIITGKENLENCDGVFTKNPDFILGVKTADCGAITFIGKHSFGVVHAGWRGLQKGIIEKMLKKFEDDQIQKISIAPLHIQFEVQKDECYKLLHKKFGDDFFVEKKRRPPLTPPAGPLRSGQAPRQGENSNENKIEFLFLEAIQSVLPSSTFCQESTFENKKWASWRRDATAERNITAVGKL